MMRRLPWLPKNEMRAGQEPEMAVGPAQRHRM